MYKHNIDDVIFFLKERREMDFLKSLGKIFCAFFENDSGNICFGIKQKNGEKVFVKIAGMRTINSVVEKEAAVENLKQAIEIYGVLHHPNLIEIKEHFQYKDLYVAIFEWHEGECLFDHWNFETYSKNKDLISPMQKFLKLPIGKRIDVFETLMSFLSNVISKGYVAIDFYDGSILYNFEDDSISICDIDFFRKAPYLNKNGNMWGSPRYKSPEEYIPNAMIDEISNVYLLGKFAFRFFAEDMNINRNTWLLNDEAFNIAIKAISPDRTVRYRSISDFRSVWREAVQYG